MKTDNKRTERRKRTGKGNRTEEQRQGNRDENAEIKTKTNKRNTKKINTNMIFRRDKQPVSHVLTSLNVPLFLRRRQRDVTGEALRDSGGRMNLPHSPDLIYQGVSELV